MIRIAKKDLEAMAQKRPEGYLRTCIKHGREDGQDVVFTYPAWRNLCWKFGNPEKPPVSIVLDDFA